jgi:hypothetical protein
MLLWIPHRTVAYGKVEDVLCSARQFVASRPGQLRNVKQAIRPMVVTRKVWGGNRTSRGAHTQSILVSILQTCRQQLRSASSILQKLICASQPKPLDLLCKLGGHRFDPGHDHQSCSQRECV